MILVLTGASGLVGKTLIRQLLREGHEIRALVRSPEKMMDLPAENIYPWVDTDIAPVAAFGGADAVIHLAGENIFQTRWSTSRKKRLRDSRIQGTKNLIAGISQINESERPHTLLAASAVGYYGNGGENFLNESSAPGNDFLAELCIEWEKASNEAKNIAMRVVVMRFGLVLAKEGGVLSKMGPIVLGNGNQWMSWIHISDLIHFVLYALKDTKISGSFNLVSPQPITQRIFTELLVKKLNYPLKMSIPAKLIQIGLGESAHALLTSQRVLPMRTLATGFRFKFENLSNALDDLFKNISFTDNRLIASQFVPKKRSAVFSFFSKAENLEILTPPWLNFQIEKISTPDICKGTLIDYKLKIHGIPVRWRTLISSWEPEKFFVDEQIRGPYSKWHHTHTFEEVLDGTLLMDEVIYRVPGFIFGKILLGPWIQKDVMSIFSYRQKKIRELMNTI